MTATNYIRGQVLKADQLDGDFGRCIDRAGDAMTGLLTLFSDPSSALHAATKQYVDNRPLFAAGNAISAIDLGFVGDGVTVNTAAFARMMALTGSQTVSFPQGTFLLPAVTAQVDVQSNISIVGLGIDRTILKWPASTTLTSNAYRWFQRSGFMLRDFTLDLNSPVIAAPHFNMLFFRNCNTFMVDRVKVINGSQNMLMVCISNDDAANIVYDFAVINSIFQSNNPTLGYGAAIQLSDGSSTMTRGRIQNNTCSGAGIGIDGSYNLVTGNRITACGGAMWTIPTFTNANSGHNIIAENNFHDMPLILNSDGDTAFGIEWDSDYDIVANNLAYRCGGPGFVLFGSNGFLIGNMAIGCGRTSAPRGTYDQVGFRVPVNRGNNNVLIGNFAKDDGGGAQLYGYYEEAGGSTAGIILRGNVFSGVTAPMLAPHNTIIDAPQGATVSSFGLNPAGTTSTTEVMAGLAVQITPQTSGIVDVVIKGAMRNSTAASGGLVHLRYGTGATPTAGAAAAGTAIGSGLQMISATAAANCSFTEFGTITGLTRGTTYWLDLGFRAITSGTATMGSIDVRATER